jgi:hypothetical protein
MLAEGKFFVYKKADVCPLILWKDAFAIASETRLEQAAYHVL